MQCEATRTKKERKYSKTHPNRRMTREQATLLETNLWASHDVKQYLFVKERNHYFVNWM